MSFNRLQTKRRSRKAMELVWPAPAAGLLRSGTLIGSPPNAAEVLENFIPTSEGARLRGGSAKFATVGDPVVRLFTHRSGTAESLFASTADAIYDISSVADVDVAPTADISSLSGGDWASTQFSTAGGDFLVIANGTDSVRNFDGTSWTTPTITGVTSADLSFVWSHASRLWFIEEGTLSAWYLPTNSIAGAATEFPFGGVFNLGGSLLFGGKWSTDSGDGPDDFCLFVTTEGEVAVYQGTDPSSASTWALVGVYRIGKPLDKLSWVAFGGDLIISTEDGTIPVSQAQSKDRAALQAAAITAPIEDLWKSSVVRRSGAFAFSTLIWPTETLFMVAVPTGTGSTALLTANTRTGAWCTITGWDVTSMAVFGDNMYFGTSAGTVFQGDASGLDDDMSYTGRYVGKFQELGSTGDKIALHARAMWRSSGTFEATLSCFQNYEIGEYPASGAVEPSDAAIWGTAVWGSFVWGSASTASVNSSFQSVSGLGFSLAPVLVITSNQVEKPEFEIVMTSLMYETGTAL